MLVQGPLATNAQGGLTFHRNRKRMIVIKNHQHILSQTCVKNKDLLYAFQTVSKYFRTKKINSFRICWGRGSKFTLAKTVFGQALPLVCDYSVKFLKIQNGYIRFTWTLTYFKRVNYTWKVNLIEFKYLNIIAL